MIWTTTPWTIPGNRAIAFSPDISYGLYQVADATDGSLARPGENLLLADTLAEQVAKHAKMMISRVRTLSNDELKSLVAAHPLRSVGYGFEVPVLPAAFVTADTGTGFVHNAPGHGEDDFELMVGMDRQYPAKNPDAFSLVQPDGSYAPHVPVFAGKRILTPEGKDGDANGAVIKELIAHGKLLAKGTLRHSYPHSWRSKAPVIFRATPQWFVAIDKPFSNVKEGMNGKTLRELALAAIAETKWYPPRGQNRIGSMVEGRPDWVLSRQRAWGVPLAIFVDKKSGEVLNDPAVFKRIEQAFEAEGADAWFTSPPARFLGNDRNPDDYEQITDILDVWFDSGSTHTFVVEQPIDAHWPRAERADLYLEGSDQHRGWFQSSLLESVGTRGHAPYKRCAHPRLRAGRAGPQNVQEPGQYPGAAGDRGKERCGNPAPVGGIVRFHRRPAHRPGHHQGQCRGLSPSAQHGAFHAGQSFRLQRAGAHRLFRRCRNWSATCWRGWPNSTPLCARPMRSSISGWSIPPCSTSAPTSCRPSISISARMRSIVTPLSSTRRRSTRTVTDEIFRRIVTWFAPILCFTMEEAWTTRFGMNDSVHLQDFFAAPAAWANPALVNKWSRIRELRRVITGALELARADKTIGSSLEAAPVLVVTDAADKALFDSVDLAEIAITSTAAVETAAALDGLYTVPEIKGAGARFAKASGEKCARCWRVLEEVKPQTHLCNRCTDAVTALRAKRPRMKLEAREVGLIAAALALVADQGSKLFMLYGADFAHLPPGGSVPVLPFFNLVMVWNPGISYGLFPASGRLGTWVLIGLSVAAICVLSWLLWRSSSRALAIGYGLIIGGAIGNNLIDRVIYGRVADFFHFYGFGYDWYVFNIADLAITLGAMAILYDVLQPQVSHGDPGHEV